MFEDTLTLLGNLLYKDNEARVFQAFNQIILGAVILFLQSESTGRLPCIIPTKLNIFYIIGSDFRADFSFSVTFGASTPVKLGFMRRTLGC